jgi:hypothetical protein
VPRLPGGSRRGSGRFDARQLQTAEGRADYERGGGLCRPHLWFVVGDAPSEVAEWLCRDAERRILALVDEFERYFHLQGYQFRDQPRGAEQSAWLRALDFFWGDVGAAAAGAGDQPKETAE